MVNHENQAGQDSQLSQRRSSRPSVPAPDGSVGSEQPRQVEHPRCNRVCAFVIPKAVSRGFFAFRSADDNALWVELELDELTEQERKTFEKRHAVLHDKDPLPGPIPADWDDAKKESKRRTFALNQEIRRLVDASLGYIEVFVPDFEGVAGVTKSEGDRKGKPLAALDHFEKVDAAQIPARIQDVVREAYRLVGS